MTNIGIFGVCGKMGRRIASLAFKDDDVTVVAAVERPDHPLLGKDLGEELGEETRGVKIVHDVSKIEAKIDCMIDFTLPDPTLEHIGSCLAEGTAMVIGTTGFDPTGEEKIQQAAKKIPKVFSPNMSVGVNVLFDIVARAARTLGGEFSIKVDETHHVHKKDSPSGTAKMIARVIKESCEKDVPVEAFREGEVIGNHGIIFDSKFETMEIRHDAKSRDVFAAGALKAAKFVSGREADLYGMSDVLGL